jgi:hypothetical protein
LLIVFIAPPWGDALDPTSGLDLRRTTPPIAEIVDLLVHRFPQNRLLLAIQVYERAPIRDRWLSWNPASTGRRSACTS